MVVVAAKQSQAAEAPKVLLLWGKPAALGPSRRPPAGVPGAQATRLMHLSPRRRRCAGKRAAAQPARDLKKARMRELEQQVVDLEEKNQKLLLENQLSQEKPHGLVAESQESGQWLGMDIPPWILTALTLQTQSDTLLGILFNLDPAMSFRRPSPESTSLEQLPGVHPEGPSSFPASPSPSLGTSSAKLEAINELIPFDHEYTKPLTQANVVVKIEEAPFSPSEKDLPEFTVSVKEELVEDDSIPELGTSDLLSSSRCLKPSSLLDA
ncbi:unnamed protein product [Nyctereutes procyonoides]|uniref:X-box-binding protein 1 n=1 Tax=Nyctereutes procyonoides TaxID=34880 RepID=A0A811XVP9_NYCPR|nr:unnamed protein product [Nyctereutes procyonoides]